MCKRTREDIYEQLVQLNDTLCRIAAALEQIARDDLIDFDDIDWDVEDGE